MADIIFPGEEPAAALGQSKLPTNVNLEWWHGDSQEIIVKFKDEAGSPITLTGYTPAAVIRASYNAPTSYNFTTTIQNGNEIRLYLPSSVSSTIPAGDYIWNLQVTAPNGDVRTYLAGDVTVYEDVD